MLYTTGGNIGDSIHSLFTMKHRGGGDLRLRLGVNAFYSGVHPLGNKRLTREWCELLTPLLLHQDYIHSCAIYAGEQIDLDLDKFRNLPINFASGTIQQWHQWAFGTPVPTEPWISAPAIENDYLIVNRTYRYSGGLNYRFLKEVKRLAFIGLPEEYAIFNDKVRCDYIRCADWLEIAGWLAGSRGVVGNQSSITNLALAMGLPLVIESCPSSPNVLPIFPNQYAAVRDDLFKEKTLQLTYTMG